MNWFQIILLLISTPAALIWLCLAVFRGKNYKAYKAYTDSAFAQEFPMNELFCIGFAVMNFFKIDTRSRHAKEKIKEISEIRGKRYAEYYYYILMGVEITYGFTVFVFALLLAVLANSVEFLLLGMVACVLVVYYVHMLIQDKLTQRRQEILMDLPSVLSKLTLLVNTGMVLREAWKKTALTGDRVLYQEMITTSMEIDQGLSEKDAYKNFAERCYVKEARKFASLINQNLEKGNEELARFLKDMSDEMWEAKKNAVKQKGEKANTKLLFPVLLIFIGILILILVPVMSGIG